MGELEIGEQNAPLIWGTRELALGEQPMIMGILNVTPDSFSDGGVCSSCEAALRLVETMLEEGADVIDVGGESTRPGASPVGGDEETRRVVPVVKEIMRRFPQTVVSVDTTKSQVAAASLDVGAHAVNDVSGLRNDSNMASVIAEFQAGCILMYNARGDEHSDSIVGRIQRGWKTAIAQAGDAGIDGAGIVLDPGIGFGTTREEDLEILRSLGTLGVGNWPILLGASRKRVTGELLNLSVDDRLETSLATTVAGVMQGVRLFRVHDVAAHRKAARMAQLIYAG